MTSFEIGEIVRIPFPYVEQDRSAVRPALVVSRMIGPDAGLLWTLMITSATRSAWPGDIDVGADHLSFGLPVPCLIRTAKITTVSVDLVDRSLGRIREDLLVQVRQKLGSYLA